MAKLLILYVTAFVDMMGLAIVLPLLPYYATAFGASAVIVGILISAFSVTQLAAAPVWGRVSDRYGRRPAILTGLVLTAGAYVIFAFADSVWLLLVSRVVQGLGGGTIGVVQAYVADASVPEERTKSLGWLSAVTSLGAVVGPPFGSLMAGLGGQQAPGIAAAALSAGVAVFAWRFLRESRLPRVSDAHVQPRAGSELQAAAHVVLKWREPAPRLIWIYAVAIGGFYGTVPIMPLLLFERLGITEHTVGYIIMYLGGMGVIVRSLILGRLVDWLGEARLSRLGIVLLAIGLTLMGLTRDYPVLIGSLTLMPLGTAFLFPCVSGLLSQIVAQRQLGLYMGLQHTFSGVARVAFPIAAGLAMDRFGLGTPFIASGVVVLAMLSLTGTLGAIREPATPSSSAAVRLAAADITAELAEISGELTAEEAQRLAATRRAPR